SAEPVSTVARREEPVRRRRQQPRERVLPESDLDDHGAGLALLQLPRRSAEEGSPRMSAQNDKTGDRPAGELTRRQMIVVTAGAIAASPLLSETSVGALVQKAAGPGGKFLTKEDFAMMDELTEMIIPADDHSPGARAAKCADYIDGWLAENFDDDVRTKFREGLKSV